MTSATAQKLSNALLSMAAGVASFVFSLAVFIHITEFDQQVAASLVAGAFCLLISYVASERPNSESTQALSALCKRLLAVEKGDLVSPAPPQLRRTMPQVAAAVDSLFAEVRSSIDSAHALGMYDPVTSLPNRLNFRAEVDRLFDMTPPCASSAMLFIDLDRFKEVNDSLGHCRGDHLLGSVASRLRFVLQDGGREGEARPLLARLAGDEFTVFFPEAGTSAEVERVARRIVSALCEPFELHGQFVDIGASVGIAMSPDHGSSIEALMRAADLAMYEAKSRGGGQFCMFSDAIAEERRARVEIQVSLTEALQRGEFRLALQPQIDLVSGRVSGAEALLRWNHPRDGMRLPATFIPIAEQAGLAARIGDCVMAEVAAMLGAWTREGDPTRIAFNVSPRELDRADYFTRLRRVLADQGVPLSLVELEFTETAVMECGETVLGEIAALRRDGASIAIDDFGTGYSNIARLQVLPFDRVKLDPSLIADIAGSEQARTMVQAVIQLIKGVGCEAVAEGVETAAQRDILRAMGCDTVPGFVFAQPMFEEEFRCWIRDAERGVAAA